MREIGQEYGISAPRVSQITKKIDGWLAPQLMAEIREMKANHTTRLMHIYSEAMREWERSKLDAESTSKMRETAGSLEDGGGRKARVVETTKGRLGDSRYLDTARAALADIRRINGADEPLDVRHSYEVRVAGRSVAEVQQEIWDRLQAYRRN